MPVPHLSPQQLAHQAAVARSASDELHLIAQRYSAIAGEASCSLISTWESTAGQHAKDAVREFQSGLHLSYEALQRAAAAADQHATDVAQAAQYAHALRSGT